MKHNARPTKRALPENAQRPLSRAGAPPPDPWWLDEPIRRPWGRGYGHDFNPKLLWFVERLPGRARALLLRAAHGELRDSNPEVYRDRVRRHPKDFHVYLPPTRTLREFLALPHLALLMQNHYGYQSHMALCQALRLNGIASQIFGSDENALIKSYPYLR